MLREDYVINITGRQFYEEDSGEVTLSTTGTYTVKDKASFIAIRNTMRTTPAFPIRRC